VPRDLDHLIQYRCVTQFHNRKNEDRERVFVQDGGWAYCAAGRSAKNHIFVSTGGVDRRRLESGLARPADRRLPDQR
jgi:hypothetical protein